MDDQTKDDFRHLFDADDDAESEVNVDELMTREAAKGFEEVPRDENFKKFDENLRENKDEIQETKVLFTPEDENGDDVSPESTATSEEEIKKVIENSVSEPKKVVEEEGIVDEDMEKDNSSDDTEVFETDSDESEESVIMNSQNLNGHPWNFSSPIPKLDNFYSEKKKIVLSIVGENPLPFDELRNELREAKIDLAALSYDAEILWRTMVRIHEWKDRVQEILIGVNSQYYLWHRFVDLLRGLLAHVAYEKPVDKFKGVIYTHMGDVEEYVAQLEGLKEDIDGVMRNLDGAANLASRHLTILTSTKQLPKKSADAYEEAQSREVEEDVREDLEDKKFESKLSKEFDSLHDEGKQTDQSDKESDSELELAEVMAWT